METFEKPLNDLNIKKVQPVTFNKKTFSPDKKYFTTYKLNGERKLLVVTPVNYAIINDRFSGEKFNLPKRPELTNTIIDCELFEKKLYAFDILFYKGKDLRQMNFKERLDNLNSAVKKINSKKLILKEHKSPYEDTLCNNFYNIIDTHKKDMKLEGKIDGVIFTPDEKYMSQPLKWKPTELITIDFKIRKIKDGDRHIALIRQDGNMFFKRNIKNLGYVKLTKEQYDTFEDPDVVEFAFKNNKFFPVRVRKDKNKANHISVIRSNLETILNPPDMRKLLSC